MQLYMKPHQEFRKSFTAKQEEAIWQYFMDHANVENNGYFRVMFHVKNTDDFFRRLYARYNGDFKRYNIFEKEYEADKKAFARYIKRSSNFGQFERQIKDGWNIKNKIILYLYTKTKHYLFSRIN